MGRMLYIYMCIFSPSGRQKGSLKSRGNSLLYNISRYEYMYSSSVVQCFCHIFEKGFILFLGLILFIYLLFSDA